MKLDDSKSALAGGAAGFCVAGPVGALVGGAICNAATSGTEHEASNRTYLPKVGGVVAAAALCVAGPISAVAAGAAAAGGAYFVRMPREDKKAVARMIMDSSAKYAGHAFSAGATYAAQQWAHLTTPRLQSSGPPGACAPSHVTSVSERRKAHAAKAAAALEEDGFALHPVDAESDPKEWRALERFLETDSCQLGFGKDVKGTQHYDSLCLACAWHVTHPAQRSKYESARNAIVERMKLLEAKGTLANGAHRSGLPTTTARIELGGGLSIACPVDEANEALLLHGTSMDKLLKVLTNGLNERYSGSNAGTAFGEGVYLAEDVGKCDQYCTADARWLSSCELHRRLFGKHNPHPGNLYYVLVCRVALGYPAITKQMGRAAKHRDTGGGTLPGQFPRARAHTGRQAADRVPLAHCRHGGRPCTVPRIHPLPWRLRLPRVSDCVPAAARRQCSAGVACDDCAAYWSTRGRGPMRKTSLLAVFCTLHYGSESL